MTPQEELIALRLRQLRRKELPHDVVKIVIGFCLLMAFSAFIMHMTGCAAPPQTKTQIKSTNDAIWAGDKEAHSRRIP